MLGRDFARTSKDLGRVTMSTDQPHLKEQEDWGQIMSKFLTDYKNQQNEEALTAALQSGDENAINQAAAAYNPQGQLDYIQRIKQAREAEDRQFERQKELAAINNAAALERIKQTYANGQGLGKGEFGSLLNFRNSKEFNSLPAEQQALVDSRLAYLSNNPELGYEQAYQKRRGAKQAEQEFEKAANVQAANQRASSLRDIINDVQNSEAIMFTPVGAIQSKLGQIGDVFGADSFGGMTQEDRMRRGAMDRAITDVGQSLIARAKSQGQAGINTAKEIDRIIGSISMHGGKAELLGALQELLEKEQEIIALEASSQYGNISNDELLGSVL